MRRKREEGKRKKSGAAAAPGFVLLYAVVIATLILAVGVSIISIATKQVAISGLGRESQYAFYAANTGTECGLFWDFHGYLQLIEGTSGAYTRLSIFPSPLGLGEAEVPEGGIDGDGVRSGRRSVLCSGTEIMTPTADQGAWTLNPLSCGSGDSCAATFTVHLDPSDVVRGPCAIVTVTKAQVGTYEVETTVDSRGYNTCDPENPRRVERGLRYTY